MPRQPDVFMSSLPLRKSQTQDYLIREFLLDVKGKNATVDTLYNTSSRDPEKWQQSLERAL
jgi:hypothetical protein